MADPMPKDPALSVMEVLVNQWATYLVLDTHVQLDAKFGGSGDLRITPGRLDRSFLQPQIGVFTAYDIDVPHSLGYLELLNDNVVQIDMGVKVLNDNMGLARKYIWQMRRNVKEILRNHKKGHTGLWLILLNREPNRPLDEPENDLLRYAQYCVCKYIF